jgi:hypothetical protein
MLLSSEPHKTKRPLSERAGFLRKENFSRDPNSQKGEFFLTIGDLNFFGSLD